MVDHFIIAVRSTEEAPITTTGSKAAFVPMAQPLVSGQARRSVDGAAVGMPDALPHRWVGRHLKYVAFLLPIAFVVALEAVRYAVAGPAQDSTPPWQGYHLLIIIVMISGIVAFSLLMFHLIERAQAALLFHNRELAATNAVARAIQGEPGLDRILDAALRTVLEATDAAYGSVSVLPATGGPGEHEAPYTRFFVRRADTAEAAADEAPSLELPLEVGARTVGRLCVWTGRDSIEPVGLAGETLRAIASQLASAIQVAQLLGDLDRRKNEGHAFYDILLQISHHRPSVEILTSVVGHARDRLSSDAVLLTLSEEAAGAVQFSGADGAQVVSAAEAARFETGLDGVDIGAVEWAGQLVAPVSGPMADLGELWVARRSGEPYSDRDWGFLSTLAGFAAIAITSAQLRENGRQRAILDERERIAREMHDSLAQVLGATHLRLRLIEAASAVAADPVLTGEVSDLADTCHEAYLDVRETILGLRDASKPGHALDETLQTYLAKYTSQSGIETRLDNRLDRRLTLSPSCEVHIIRVIQEALTNVRKHAGAGSVTVRVTEDGAGTVFVVEDDGRGFDMAAQKGDGFGLFTMRDRMALLQGSLAVDSAPGRGTRVVARVPERSKPCSVIVR